MKLERVRGGRRAGVLGGVALASVLVAGSVGAQTQAQEQNAAPTLYEEPAKSGMPFWDDANIGYMFRTASFNRSSSGDPNVPGRAFKQAGANQRAVGLQFLALDTLCTDFGQCP